VLFRKNRVAKLVLIDPLWLRIFVLLYYSIVLVIWTTSLRQNKIKHYLVTCTR